MILIQRKIEGESVVMTQIFGLHVSWCWRGGLFQSWLPLWLGRTRLERLARLENNVSQHGT